MLDDMPLLEKIDGCGVLLDKLVDAQGRAKCGCIYILGEYIDSIRKDVLILEEKLRDETMSPE